MAIPMTRYFFGCTKQVLAQLWPCWLKLLCCSRVYCSEWRGSWGKVPKLLHDRLAETITKPHAQMSPRRTTPIRERKDWTGVREIFKFWRRSWQKWRTRGHELKSGVYQSLVLLSRTPQQLRMTPHGHQKFASSNFSRTPRVSWGLQVLAGPAQWFALTVRAFSNTTHRRHLAEQTRDVRGRMYGLLAIIRQNVHDATLQQLLWHNRVSPLTVYVSSMRYFSAQSSLIALQFTNVVDTGYLVNVV